MEAVMLSATMASVMELSGRLRVPLTIKLEILAPMMVELVIVVVVNVVVAEKVLRPVKVWLLASLARVAASDKLLDDRPVTVAPVKFKVDETVNDPIVEVLEIIPPQALSSPVMVPPASGT